MDQENIVMDSEVIYPILLIPKKCTTLLSNCDVFDNVYLDLNITSPDTEGNETLIYSGCCNVKFINSRFDYDYDSNEKESPNENLSPLSLDYNDEEQMPIILSEADQMSFLSYNQSQVWIDPVRSPFVYNHYDESSQNPYAIHEATGHITVEKHNTYITQNVYNNYNESNIFNHLDPQQSANSYFEQRKFKKAQETSNQQEFSANFYDYEFEYGDFQPELIEETVIEKQSKGHKRRKVVEHEKENNALKQLMSTDAHKVSKQQKTILFLGNDSSLGQTIQNISYNDPTLRCTGLEVSNEVVIEDSARSTKKKKRYQCDKCKQIFDQTSEFHQHMYGNHNIQLGDKDVNFICSECGKKLKDQLKFERHCLGHGNPELECPKCHKVYATKSSLKVHLKIHERKFPCTMCFKSYSVHKDLKSHLARVHKIFLCKHNGCNYDIGQGSDLNHYHDRHINKANNKTECGESFNKRRQDKNVITAEEANLKGDESNNVVNDIEGEMIWKADSVIAKVMSNNIFLMNSKKANKQAKNNKTCGVCDKSFDRIGDLKRHLIEHIIKSTLSKNPVGKNGILNIICEICQSSFTTVDKYKAHLREHAKLTLYKCTFCDKSFSDSSNFSKHKKIHGDAYYQCDLCQRKFNTKKMIAQHMIQHDRTVPVECRLCYKTFHFQSMLNKHIKATHTKQSTERFRCKLCACGFKALKDKWDHDWLVHKVRKTIVDCSICGAKFRKFSELRRHNLDYHKTRTPSARKVCKKRLYYY